MTYTVIVNRDKLEALKGKLGFSSNASFYRFMRERVVRHLADFSTVRDVRFSGKRIGSGHAIVLELSDPSEIEQLTPRVEACVE